MTAPSSPSMSSPQLLTPAALASALGLATRTIYNRMSAGGDLPTLTRLGRLPRFAVADVEHWLASKRVHPPESQPHGSSWPNQADRVARLGELQ